MPLITVVSAKGSPGATTTALALATMWPAPRRLLAELDPAGGDLAIRLSLPAGGGLVGLAAAARRPQARHSLWPFACELSAGLHVLLAPPGAAQASACLATLAGTGVMNQLAVSAAAGDAVVIADCGRFDPVTGQAGLLAGAVLVVARPHLSDLAHLPAGLDALRQHAGVTGLVLATGAGVPRTEPTYPGREIAHVLDVPVLGILPADPRGAAALAVGRGQPPHSGRLPLLAAARALAHAVTRALPPGPGPVAGRGPAHGQKPPDTGQQGSPEEAITR
jgi:MinD-like ATPase involved in chromosome partitioning or flagellar assembly